MLRISNPEIEQPIFRRWDLKEEIGRGKYGTVYKALDTMTGASAAVKIISLPNQDILNYALQEFGDDENAIANYIGQIAENFGNEIESMKKLENVPYVIRLYDNRLYQRGMNYDIVMVMEYAIPLKEYFKNRKLTVGDVIKFGSDIALGLAECEKSNIIHRDIKEDNLFIGIHDGCGKLGDFGVASISESGLGSTVGMGTPYYMAPEVARGRKGYGNTADIYSLGIVLFKMLNNNIFPLSDGSVASSNAALDRRMRGEAVPYPAYAKNELGDIVRQCCEYDPARRFISARELFYALQYVKQRMSEKDLRAVIPYNNKSRKIGPYPLPPDKGGKTPDKKEDDDIKNETMGIWQKLIDKEGRNSTIAAVFGGLLQAVNHTSAVKTGEDVKKRKRTKALLGTSGLIIVLAGILTLLYPKTASFRINKSDNMIYVKYMFLPEVRKSDIPASYLNVDGNWLYFSNPDEDHTLYRMSIWSDKTEVLCEDDCEHDIVIGDYVCFTSYDEGEILCRIKKDGTGEKEVILGTACRELEKKGNLLSFEVVGMGKTEIIDPINCDAEGEE